MSQAATANAHSGKNPSALALPGTINEDEVAFASLVKVFKAYQSQDLTQTN